MSTVFSTTVLYFYLLKKLTMWQFNFMNYSKEMDENFEQIVNIKHIWKIKSNSMILILISFTFLFTHMLGLKWSMRNVHFENIENSDKFWFWNSKIQNLGVNAKHLTFLDFPLILDGRAMDFRCSIQTINHFKGKGCCHKPRFSSRIIFWISRCWLIFPEDFFFHQAYTFPPRPPP